MHVQDHIQTYVYTHHTHKHYLTHTQISHTNISHTNTLRKNALYTETIPSTQNPPPKYHWHSHTHTTKTPQLIIFSVSHCFLFPKHLCSHLGDNINISNQSNKQFQILFYPHSWGGGVLWPQGNGQGLWAYLFQQGFNGGRAKPWAPRRQQEEGKTHISKEDLSLGSEVTEGRWSLQSMTQAPYLWFPLYLQNLRGQQLLGGVQVLLSWLHNWTPCRSFTGKGSWLIFQWDVTKSYFFLLWALHWTIYKYVSTGRLMHTRTRQHALEPTTLPLCGHFLQQL